MCDSLEQVFRAVPLTRIVTCVTGCHTEAGEPDYPALAAAVREWIKEQLPPPMSYEGRVTLSHQDGYNDALADVAGRLGLSR